MASVITLRGLRKRKNQNPNGVNIMYNTQHGQGMTQTATGQPQPVQPKMTVEEELEQIRMILGTMHSNAVNASKIEVAGVIKLTSTNLSQLLNSDYYYSLSFLIVGGAATDTNINLTVVQEQINTPMRLFLNTGVVKVNINGLRISSISTDSTSLSSATVYVAYIGYRRPTIVEIKFA